MSVIGEADKHFYSEVLSSMLCWNACSRCKHSDPNRVNEAGEIRCKRFSRWTGGSSCNEFKHREVNNE